MRALVRKFLAWCRKGADAHEGRVCGYMTRTAEPVDPLSLKPPCGDTAVTCGPPKGESNE